jgi:hypothetical protein
MAMLNWGGDAGLAWNEDVKRATYSSRTRGEGQMAIRRKNPMFSRVRGSGRGWQPTREKSLRELQDHLGEEAFNERYEYFGDNEPFWTWDRMEDFRAQNPDIRSASYKSPEAAIRAVREALERMVAQGSIPDLAPARGEVNHYPLARAVPLIRDLGPFTTRVSATDHRTIYPYRVGLLGTMHDKRMHDRGRVIQAPPFGADFGPEAVNPYIAEHMTRPASRKVVTGEIVYRIPPDALRGDAAEYDPYRVLSVAPAPPERTGLDYRPSDLLTLRKADTAMSILNGRDYSRGYDDAVVDEWDVLKEDEMPPDTDYPRVVAPRPAPVAGEALTAAAAKPLSKKTKVIAVVSEPGQGSYDYVVLLSPDVLVKGELSEADVLGFATASYYANRNEATISVAAAEPGYGFLLYATLAKSIASQHPHAMLRGSNVQTKYAERFWARQPGGAVGDMPPALFRKTFGMTYASITSAGEEVVRRLAASLGGYRAEQRARDNVRSLGSTYFDDYYRVSNRASAFLGPEKLPRPASPRQTLEEVKKLTERKLSSNSLALVVTTVPPYGTTRAYLLSVPKGKSTLTPANLVAEFDPTRPGYPGARAGDFADVYGPLAARKLSPEAAKVMQVLREYNTDAETALARREVAKWAARGEVLKGALAVAGLTDLDGLFSYLSRGARTYGERAQRIAGEQPRKLNPRRKKFEVTIVMPA